MNPRLSLQGRMSLDGWNGPADRGMDIHMGGVAGRHGRQSSLYKAQSTTLFNAFEEEEGGARPHANGHRHKQSNSELRQVAETDEWSEDDDGSDEHTPVLRKGLRRQQQQHANASSIALPLSSARSHSHSPTSDAALTDVRITPR